MSHRPGRPSLTRPALTASPDGGAQGSPQVGTGPECTTLARPLAPGQGLRLLTAPSSAGARPPGRRSQNGIDWSAKGAVSGPHGVPSPTPESTAERAPSVWSAFRVVGMVEAGGVEPPSRVRRMTTEGSTQEALALAWLRGAMTSGPLSGPRLRPAAPRTGSHATPVPRGHFLSVAREGPVPATALPPSSRPRERIVPVAVGVPMPPPTLIRTSSACSWPGQ